MYLSLIDHQGTTLVDENVRCEKAAFLREVDPYKHDLVVTAECIFCWYWLADLCRQAGRPSSIPNGEEPFSGQRGTRTSVQSRTLCVFCDLCGDNYVRSVRGVLALLGVFTVLAA
jgi:hypothetical protein